MGLKSWWNGRSGKAKKALIVGTAATVIAAVAGLSQLIDVKKAQATRSSVSAAEKVRIIKRMNDTKEYINDLQDLTNRFLVILEDESKNPDKQITTSKKTELLNVYNVMCDYYYTISKILVKMTPEERTAFETQCRDVLTKIDRLIREIHDFLVSKGVRIK